MRLVRDRFGLPSTSKPVDTHDSDMLTVPRSGLLPSLSHAKRDTMSSDGSFDISPSFSAKPPSLSRPLSRQVRTPSALYFSEPQKISRGMSGGVTDRYALGHFDLEGIVQKHLPRTSSVGDTSTPLASDTNSGSFSGLDSTARPTDTLLLHESTQASSHHHLSVHLPEVQEHDTEHLISPSYSHGPFPDTPSFLHDVSPAFSDASTFDYIPLQPVITPNGTVHPRSAEEVLSLHRKQLADLQSKYKANLLRKQRRQACASARGVHSSRGLGRVSIDLDQLPSPAVSVSKDVSPFHALSTQTHPARNTHDGLMSP